MRKKSSPFLRHLTDMCLQEVIKDQREHLVLLIHADEGLGISVNQIG
jgi:hypothetical protein